MGDIISKESSFKGYDGIELFYQAWLPKRERGSIVIVHGAGEHSSRYAHVGDYFANLGYAVYAYDQRGHGRSRGRRGCVKNFNEYILDLKRFASRLSAKENIFILGHSLGGLIAIRFTMDYPEGITGLIATSPVLGLNMRVPAWKKFLAYALHLIYPTFTLIDDAIPSRYLSHDTNVCESCDNDPLVHKLRSVRFFTEYLKTSIRTTGEPGKLKTPCLILQAGDDKIASVEAVKRFYQKISSEKKTLKIYPHFYHEILNETDKEKVLRDIREFLESF
ncbi:MAG: alpha/beta hydrolase [Candidatus Omnitrophica bacterium]|nr:alpha/beta hydrolase [Candidatus Omnitrophota bacterium]